MDGSGDEPVSLDGTGSSDPEGGVLTYVWSIDGAVTATDATATITIPVGTRTVRLTVTDPRGATATDEVVMQIDAPPPDETPANPGLNPDGSPTL
jgi:hypothetical protein